MKTSAQHINNLVLQLIDRVIDYLNAQAEHVEPHLTKYTNSPKFRFIVRTPLIEFTVRPFLCKYNRLITTTWYTGIPRHGIRAYQDMVCRLTTTWYTGIPSRGNILTGGLMLIC